MEDDEFNFHRLAKSEKKVAQPALQDLFETLWNAKYPESLWAKNAESVELFEEKDDEHFQKSLQGLSNREKGRKTDKRNRLQNTFKDDKWKNYEWDTGKYVYALVDCKLFTLDQTDETGMQVSEHIVKIKDIRNEIAHSTTDACDTNYFEKTLKSLEEHIKALEIVKLNATPHREELQRIKSEEKPVSAKEHYQLKVDSEILKNSQKIYEEREKHFKEINKEREKHAGELKKERQKHCGEIKEKSQKHKEEIKEEKEKHVEEMKEMSKKHTEEINKTLEDKNRLQEQVNEMSAELNRLKAENSRLRAKDNNPKTKNHSPKKDSWLDDIRRLIDRLLILLKTHGLPTK
ncbi:DNA ligase 1-like [Mercenaria mercenaria]|uniref:DNA ligase 1-like n=1 Tax=Mercenaria mercenaria TaxID=6596 RepID=UPI00234EC0DC|nr:DNA ligase 1-like [Mercenaria mercenaria]